LSASSNSLPNGLSSFAKSTGVEASNKIVPSDKTSPSLIHYLAKNSSTILCLLFILHTYHHATDVASTTFVCQWILLLRPWLRRRMPHRLALLPAKSPHRQAPLPFTFPSKYLLYSSYMLLMSFVGFLIALANLGGVVLTGDPLTDPQPLRVPSPPPPDPHDFHPRRTRGQPPSKRLLHLGLLAALSVSKAVPTLGLQSDKQLRRDLQKYRGASGFVVCTAAIQSSALSRLRTVLEASQCHLLTKDDTFELIMDSGCLKSVSPCISDFVPESLVDLSTPLSMDGIAGQLIAHQKGRLRYEVLNDAGGITVLECNGYHLPKLKIPSETGITCLSPNCAT
jgi:hypothetical protein